MTESRPTDPCNCPDPAPEGDICVKCWGLDPKIKVKKVGKNK